MSQTLQIGLLVRGHAPRSGTSSPLTHSGVGPLRTSPEAKCRSARTTSGSADTFHALRAHARSKLGRGSVEARWRLGGGSVEARKDWKDWKAHLASEFLRESRFPSHAARRGQVWPFENGSSGKMLVDLPALASTSWCASRIPRAPSFLSTERQSALSFAPMCRHRGSGDRQTHERFFDQSQFAETQSR
jgi:hypothetical protein